MNARRVFMVAAEPSGDLLAREVIEALRAADPELAIAGIGGEECAKAGIVSPIDIAPLSILGLFEGLKAYGTVVKLADAAAEAIIAFAPDAVVLVDSWGFMLRVAQRVRKRAPKIKLVKLVGPQVWATRAGRAKTLASTVDHLICIHAMEAPYYAPHGLPVTVMGNPALSRAQPGDGRVFRVTNEIGADDELVLVLPGSRPSEIERVAPVLVDTARRVKAARPAARIVFAPAPSVAQMFAERFGEVSEWGLIAPREADRYDMMAAADLALACSGTVTSELAVQGVPFLVGYKLGWITWALARFFLYKPAHITLLNIAADDTEIAPEYIQTKLKADLMAHKAIGLLADRAALSAQQAAQNKALLMMGEGDDRAPDVAAEAILSVLNAT